MLAVATRAAADSALAEQKQPPEHKQPPPQPDDISPSKVSRVAAAPGAA